MTDAAIPVADRLPRIRDRHFDCYADLADAAERATAEGADWFERLDSEIANIRSALEWGLATDRPETAAFAASLLWYWRKSHSFAEARHVLDRALRHPDLPETGRIDALFAAGALAWDQNDRAVARERFEESQRLAVSVGDRRGQARAAMWLGWAYYHTPLTEQAVEAFNEALALPESLSVAERANALRGLAWAKRDLGDEDTALELHRGARTLLEQAGDPDITAHYLVETNFLVEMGRVDEAFALAEQAVAVARAGAGNLIFALIAREKAAEALGDEELLRRVVGEGIRLTQTAGQLSVGHAPGHFRQRTTFEAQLQGRLIDHAMLHGDIDTARSALDRALRLLDGLDNLNPREVGVRAGVLALRAQLAEEDGDLDAAEELHRQVIQAYRASSPVSHAGALAALARFLAAHGNTDGGRLALVQAAAAADGVDRWAASDAESELAIFDDDLEEALGLITEALDGYRQQGNQALPLAHRRRAALLAELGRFEESVAMLDEAVTAAGETYEVGERARTHADRARVRIALGDGDGARSDLLETSDAARIGWASDQLQLAATFARLALLEGRRDRAAELWAAVVAYRTANRRLAPPLSRRFEGPLRELNLTTGPPALDSRAALEALRSLVSEEFAALGA